MTKTIRLTDLQLVLLSQAAKNELGAVHPLPECAANDPEYTAKDLKSLLRRGLLVEAEVDNPAAGWRTDDDGQHLGLLLSGMGRDAIGLGTEADAADTGTGAPITEAATPPATPRGGGKQAMVIALLQRDEGATIGELMTATGWLPHSTRAALTGLRKKGHVIDKSKREGETCYHITGASV